MSTVQTIIDDAATEIGVLVAGRALAANDQAWILRKFNYMLQSFSRDGFMFNTKVREDFSLASGIGMYTIGDSGLFNTVRPVSIDAAFVRLLGHDYPVRVRPMYVYDRLTDKSTRIGRPKQLFYNPKHTLGEIFLYPKPDIIYDLHIVSVKPFTTYTDLALEVEVPIEFDEMLMLNLAVRIAGRYGKMVSTQTRDDAKATWKDIKSDNMTKRIEPVEFTGKGTYDIDGDTYQ